MKIPVKCVVLVSLVILFAACVREEPASGIPIINFEAAEERSVDVSEILEHPRFVRLETKVNAFIKDARFAVGEKYIIAATREAILQFTGEGAFIRILARRGAGPQEFQEMRAFSMDNKEQKLYIDHIGRKTTIMVFDLDSGNFDRIIEKPLQALHVGKGFSLDKMLVVNDSMYCIPERNYTGEPGFYIQRTSGDFLTAFPRGDRVTTPGAHVVTHPFLAREPERNHIRFKPRDVDTVFSISGTAKEPYVAVTYKDKLIYQPDFTEVSGNLLNMVGEGPTTILFEKLHGTLKRITGGTWANGDLEGSYLTDKADFRPVKISRLMMDEMEFPGGMRSGRSHDTMFFTIPAVYFKELLESAIENSAGKPEALERWQSLDEQVSEYDNPILLVGKMK